MAQPNKLLTPHKSLQQTKRIPETAEHTPEQLSHDLQAKLDYKAKNFKLMKQMAQLQVAHKRSFTQIRHLQNEVQAYKKQFDKIFRSLSAYKKIDDFMRNERKNMNQMKISQWSNIVEQYKKIINTQQYKFIKLEQQLKIAEVKIKRYEQNVGVPKELKEKKPQEKQRQEKAIQTVKTQEEEIAKLKGQLSEKQKQVTSLGEELVILKKEYKQLLIQRQNIKDMYEELQGKYNLQIQHFEEMEKHVEERLIEVERQMNFYRFQREGHIEKIELMKKELKLNESKQFFSFGGVKHISTQTDFQQESSPFNSQCMQISIKTLLQQNDKLKNNLLILYTKKPDDELPKEIELEMKILLNMHDANLNYKAIEAHKGQEVVEVDNRTKSMVSESIEQLVEEQNCEEEQKVSQDKQLAQTIQQ